MMAVSTPRRAITTVLIALAAIAIAVVVVFAPGWIVSVDLAGQAVSAAERLDAVNGARTTILQAVGGLVLTLGAYATWRRLRINEEELRSDRDGQITERYSRAIEHLGSESRDVRIGGIYALERVARNSAEDRAAIVAVLCAYIRGHSPWPPVDGEETGPAAEDLRSLAIRANDVQVALTALGRLDVDRAEQDVAIPRTDLRHARLSRLNFSRARLSHVSLIRARIHEANLREAILNEADLRLADLGLTDLREADLRGADLRGASLNGTRLDGAILDGARADAATAWPDGFDPAAAGVQLTA
jgi:hypothetical protein